ncbi:MAG: hypothetical protein ACRCW4_00505 [Candidatus Neomicrothrix subdominans]
MLSIATIPHPDYGWRWLLEAVAQLAHADLIRVLTLTTAQGSDAGADAILALNPVEVRAMALVACGALSAAVPFIAAAKGQTVTEALQELALIGQRERP